MVINKIYLDMDGVLCSFNKRYEELFGESPGKSRDRKNFSSNWAKFIEGENFATLDWNEGGQELLAYVRTIPNIEIEMLTSSGGQKHHTEVSIQKTQWLCERGILYKANICPGSRLKAQYADPSIILIDDTDYVLDGFVKAGGIGILHKNVNETIRQLELYFEEEYVLPPHTD
jgi:hypothetical protein